MSGAVDRADRGWLLLGAASLALWFVGHFELALLGGAFFGLVPASFVLTGLGLRLGKAECKFTWKAAVAALLALAACIEPALIWAPELIP